MTALLSATFGGLLVGLLISSAIVVSDPGSMTGGSGETVEIQQVAPPEGGERAGGGTTSPGRSGRSTRGTERGS